MVVSFLHVLLYVIQVDFESDEKDYENEECPKCHRV